MKIIASLIFFCFLTVNSFSQTKQIKGRILDEQLNPIPGAQINDLKNHQASIANAEGFYSISASVSDTIKYKFVGSTNEIRIVINPEQHINVILIDKTLNDLGVIWTKKQWERAEKKTKRYYHQLEIKADQSGKWNY
jgi:hypothetical protein